MKSSLRSRASSLHRALWLVLLPIVAAPVGAETVDTISRSFDVHSGGELVVDVDRGGITVEAIAGSKVVVELVRKVSADSEEQEKELLAQDEITIEQSGDTVRIHARGDREHGSWWRSLMRSHRRDYRYQITVPTEFDVDLKTSGGGIDVNGLVGEVRANTSGGGLRFEGITGPIDGRTSGGGIKLVACAGDVKVHTSGGGIETRDGHGALDLDTSGGSIKVDGHDGDVLAHTSGGGITAESIRGNIDGRTSGGSIRASLLARPTGECRLSTSGGGITVALPEDAAVALDASTSAGSVHCDFPVTSTGEIKRDRINGTINGGGPLLHLRSSAGSVNIVKGPATRGTAQVER